MDIAGALAPVVKVRELRKLSEQTGVSIGYLSDLARGKAGPPAAKTAKRIDEVAGTKLDELASRSREIIDAIRREARAREAEVLRFASRARETGDRLTRVSMALTGDPDLLDLTERISRLPKPARDALGALLSELAR